MYIKKNPGKKEKCTIGIYTIFHKMCVSIMQYYSIYTITFFYALSQKSGF